MDSKRKARRKGAGGKTMSYINAYSHTLVERLTIDNKGNRDNFINLLQFLFLHVKIVIACLALVGPRILQLYSLKRERCCRKARVI